MALTLTPEAFTAINFDFLIAGGGTAGLAIANRLSEIPTIQVGVVEAGQDLTEDDKVRIPLNFFDVQENPKYDYNFQSEPQVIFRLCVHIPKLTHLKEALDGLVVAQARGRMLGGSSGINFLQFTFASQEDINDWAQLGNEGWDYAGLAPYYKKFENFQGFTPSSPNQDLASFYDPSVHGNGGPINGSLSPYQLPIQQAWAPTLKAMGLAPNGDPRNGIALGGYNSPTTQTRGSSIRSFSGNSYWKPFANRPNLHVITDAVVNKIVFSDQKADGNLVATGLNFTVNGQSYIANASKEVVVSGGTMNSPQLLELSGIGQKKVLEPLGIPILYENNGVGENFQDHPQLGIIFEPNDDEPTFDELYDPERYQFWLNQFNSNGTGMLAGGITTTAQLSWSQILKFRNLENRPQEMVNKWYNETYRASLTPGLRKQLDLTVKKILDPNQQDVQSSAAAGSGTAPVEGEPPRGKSASVGGFVCHAMSRGWIHINSTDATQHARFSPNYLSHPLDWEVIKDNAWFSFNVSTTAPLSNHIKNNGTKLSPAGTVLNTDEDLIAYTKKALITGWHPVGSNAMLPEGDGGVVSTKLVVYGTKNLRVIDASIIPLHVRGNTVSVTYAIAEKGADLIKADIGAATSNPTDTSGKSLFP